MKVLAISNNLKVNKSLQTKVIRYFHRADAFGFEYSNDPSFSHQFRIEAVFGRITKFPVIEKVYRDQSGNFQNQNVSIDKQKTLKIGYVDQNSHAAIAVALKHSSVYIDDVKFFHQGEYEIDGDDDDTLTNLIQAKATLNQQGYNKTSVTC
jgi:hypothetical protein